MSARIVLLCVLIIIIPIFGSYSTCTNSTLVDFKRHHNSTLRLSNTTEPLSYELWLETRIHERILDYTGRVKITIRALEPSRIITINSENLELRSYSFYDHQNNLLRISYAQQRERLSFVDIFLEDDLIVGQEYLLDISFFGVLQSIPRGFCYTRYIQENGDLSYVATSFLHVTNARMAFPCYDEPRYRAPFKIHIIHHPSMIAASNMPVKSIANRTEDMVMTSFQESVAMPVNLVAFTVCNYASRKVFLKEKNLEISFLVPKHFVNQLDFAMDFIIFTVNKLEEYLGVGYNLPKLESVVVNDLMHNGLENWGLMVYDSKSLLFNKTSTTPGQKMEIGRTIAHQLVHNYFGNLIGMSWWSFAWMTEGFANYHEYFFTSYFLPDFPLNDIFVTDFIQKNLVENSYLMSTSLNKYVQTRKEIEDAFDFGMVSKAAGVLRMCDNMVGRPTFQKGLQKYVREMAYKVASPEDFYRSIQAAVTEDQTIPENLKISSIMSSWTDQPGYPLLTVMRNYQTNDIVVNQQRFLSSRDEFDRDGLSWYIPLSISTAKNPIMNNTRPWAWLMRGTRELVIKTIENQTWTTDDWVLFNIQQTGYYRVNYDTHNWRLLASDLYKGAPYKIGLINRAQLIDDSFNLAYSDIVQFTIALDIIKYVKHEREYAVWVTAYRHLLNMIRRLDGHSYALYYGRFLQHLTYDHFDRLDVFENTHGKDTVKDSFLRPIIVDLACRSGSGMCLIATRTMVTAEALTGHVLAPHEKPNIYYCHGLKNADEDTFQYFWRKLKALTNEQERIHIATSISCYHNFNSVYSLLLETANPNLVDVFYTNLERFQILMTAARNGNVKAVIHFLRENHDDIARTYSYNIRMEQGLKEISGCLQEEDQQEFVELLQILLAAGHISSNLVERCMIDMEYQRKWVKDNKGKIEEWIAEYFKPLSNNSATVKLSYLLIILLSIVQFFMK